MNQLQSICHRQWVFPIFVLTSAVLPAAVRAVAIPDFAWVGDYFSKGSESKDKESAARDKVKETSSTTPALGDKSPKDDTAFSKYLGMATQMVNGGSKDGGKGKVDNSGDSGNKGEGEGKGKPTKEDSGYSKYLGMATSMVGMGSSSDGKKGKDGSGGDNGGKDGGEGGSRKDASMMAKLMALVSKVGKGDKSGGEGGGKESKDDSMMTKLTALAKKVGILGGKSGSGDEGGDKSGKDEGILAKLKGLLAKLTGSGGGSKDEKKENGGGPTAMLSSWLAKVGLTGKSGDEKAKKDKEAS